MLAYTYPGNERELENAVERSVALSLGGELRLDNLPHEFTVIRSVPPSPQTSGSGSLAESVHTLERSVIEEALRSTGNRKGEAAKLLGISRKTLWEKLKQLELM